MDITAFLAFRRNAVFGELQDKGFLKCRQKGSFNMKGGDASLWELTMEPCDGNLASKDFMNWRPSKNKNTVSVGVTTGHAESDHDRTNVAKKDGSSHPESGHKGVVVPLHGHSGSDTYILPRRG